MSSSKYGENCYIHFLFVNKKCTIKNENVL